ncbi:hypothetical protein [Janthinobacterium aquaticum]|uniref:hypothetical protein n=1 Tax=Janthinobacterium sp. FT58W TaxID=2654254 RepID=UPI00186AC792|nr:hypothetical protein [Janthinobacterium sp. FT58W]
MQGFVRGWYRDCGKLAVVDKNNSVELLLELAPKAKLAICVRELGQIYGSIEAQHQRTILLDFINHLADHDRMGRADLLFAKDRTIGAPRRGFTRCTIPKLASKTGKRKGRNRSSALRCNSSGPVRACNHHQNQVSTWKPYEVPLVLLL